jgi:hypothetical protein
VNVFVSGLDLGQTEDYSALAVLEKEGDSGAAVYSVRHLERYPLGTSYVQIVQAVASRFRSTHLGRF